MNAALDALPRDQQARPEAPAHLAPLPGGDWAVWRWVGLRGAGFPADLVSRLADAECARSADAVYAAEARAAELQAQALAAANAALDALRAGAGWDDPARRKPLLKLMRVLKAGDAPAPAAAPPALAPALAALLAARAELAGARAQFAQAFDAATRNTSHVIATIAGDDRFCEALIWQNRRAFHTGVAALRAGTPGATRGSQQRQHEELVASYLQRYCVKNDTIGFFGPVGWATIGTSAAPLVARPGQALLRRRTVAFEQWAIDGLAAALAKTRLLQPWLAPRLLPFFDLRGTTLYRPGQRTLRVSPGQAAVLAACDGERSARAIAAELCAAHPHELSDAAAVYRLLDQLGKLGLIVWTLEVPFAPQPDLALGRLLARIEDPRLRTPALDALAELERRRAEVAQAAGNAAQLDQALDALEASFTRLTGAEATRKAGATYAARTLVYEDCQRDIDIELGAPLLDALGPPLTLLLTSARWITHQAAGLYQAAFDQIYAELARQSGSAEVDLFAFWQLVQQRLHTTDQPRLRDTVKHMFQQRWAEVLGLPPDSGQREIVYTSTQLAPQVAAAFAAPGPGWPGARYHSPDVMIAAASPEAICQGQYLLVMGELHLGGNSLRAALFVDQHPAPAELIAAIEHDLPMPQVAPIAPRNWPEMTLRTRSAFLSERDFRLAFTYDACGHSHPLRLPIGAFVVARNADGLVIRARDGSRQFGMIELFAEILTMEVADCFKIFSPRRHTPRITIDRLVVSRECWQVATAELAFAGEQHADARFLAARRWARGLGLPRCVFVKVPIERKPFFLDFDSPILVNLFARMARRVREQAGAEALISITEMCPTIEESWLPDAAGARYTSELRIAAVDWLGAAPGEPACTG